MTSTTKVWKRHVDGEEMPIADMVNEHLLSAINMLERGYDYKGRPVAQNWKILYLPDLEEEAMRRGIIDNGGWDK